MKYSIILLLSIILIAGISAPAYAQTLSDHVVINEVDTNPNGDDSLSISEWVELYNPTDSDIDISGWEIVSTTVLKKTFTIPDGTIISPSDFLTYTNERIWFTDSGELVELRNADGIIIDQTPSISDLQNNFHTWQRSYDGYSDWEFALGSPGGSNGKFLIPSTVSPVSISITSDKTSYLFDDTAIIQGTVSERIFIEKPSFQIMPIKINISGPDFYQAVSLYPDNNLNYETTLDLVQVLGINPGNYDVSVNYGDVTNVTTFSVGFDVVKENEKQIESFLNVQTDKSEYFPGESVLIHAFTSNIIPFESMVLAITDSNNDLIDNRTLFSSNGNFSTSIFVNPISPNYGEYNVNAKYSEYSMTSTFNVVPLIVASISDEITNDSIILKIDKSEYVIDELITISGIITNFVYNPSLYAESVKISFTDSNGNSPTFIGAIKDSQLGSIQHDFTLDAIIDDSGEFSVTFRALPVLFSEGDYVLTVNYTNLNKLYYFSIETEPSIIQNQAKFENGYSVSNIQTVIEKVNRISDNLISIISQEKIINEQSVKPRVLSGSMITTDKSRQSNVNLQVKSESGICIIGQNSDCLVSESTRKPGQIFEVVQVDGLNLNVRYSGTDVRLEKFSILPESSDEFLPDTNWNVKVIKDNEISRFYYKITYKTLQ